MPVTPAKYSILGLALSVLAILASVLVGPSPTHAKKMTKGVGATAEVEMVDTFFAPQDGKWVPVVVPDKVNC